jgi:hypothetical protein
VTTDDIVEPAVAGELAFRASSLAPSTAVTIAGLADLAPTTLALMHGSSFAGTAQGRCGTWRRPTTSGSWPGRDR